MATGGKSKTPPNAAAAADPLQFARLAMSNRRPQDAQRIAEDVLKRAPQNAPALYILGCALLMQGRPQQAVAPLDAAARIGNDPETDLRLAMALYQAGDRDGAMRRLKRATKRRPPYAPAFHELGYLLSCAGRFDEAIEVFRRGVEIAPMMPIMWIDLGHALLERRNYAEAGGAFARALQILPASPEALSGRARALQELGEPRAAVELFRRYLTINPNDADAWVRLGQCHLDLGEFDAGHESFRKAAHGDGQRYNKALGALVRSRRGRFWLKPSDAERFVRGNKP